MLPRDPRSNSTPIRFLNNLMEPGQVVEVRILKHNKYGHTASGYFDNPEALVKAALAYDGRASIYVTLNPVIRTLLSRYHNRIEPKAEHATADPDVTSRRWLFVDIDAVRPAGISSTEEEVGGALNLGAAVRAEMAGEDWPEPVVCMSGNGCYLLYRIDLPNTPEATALVKATLEALAQRFNNEAAHIDTSVHNPARIIGLVGTVKVKGDSTEERPHRRSAIVSEPDELTVVTEAQLKTLAAFHSPGTQPPPRRDNGATLARDLPSIPYLLDRAGIRYREQPADAAGNLWYDVEECPFHGPSPAFTCGLGKAPDSRYLGKCFHNRGQDKGWSEWKVALGLDRFFNGNTTSARSAPSDPKTAPPAIYLGALLDAAVGFVRRYVVLREDQHDAIVLWTAHTYVIDAAEATPYLNIHSAEKRSGKSRLEEVLALLVNNPWLTGRVTAAVLVRKMDRDAPTLLLDESDAAFNGEKEYAEALRGVLNNGHRRGGVASLCVKKGSDFDLRDFSVFGPKAIAGIGKLPGTVADRSIPIEMRRRAAGEIVDRFRRRKAEPEAAELRQVLANWATSAVEPLRDAEPELPPALDDRAADGWEPLLAIADLAGGDWPGRARRAALQLSTGAARDDDSNGVTLLRDVRTVFADRGSDRVTSVDLASALCAIEEAPWGDWRGGKPLDARALARLLKPYGLKPRQVRFGDKTGKGYEAGDFADAWRRYLPVGGETSETTETKSGSESEKTPEGVSANDSVSETRVLRETSSVPKLSLDGRDVSDVSDVSANPEKDNGDRPCHVCGAPTDRGDLCPACDAEAQP